MLETVDLHCGQIQGFFGPRVPVDNLDGGMVGVSYFGDKDLHNPVVVSPDAGGVYRAKQFREGLASKFDIDAGLAMIVKQRAKANEVMTACLPTVTILFSWLSVRVTDQFDGSRGLRR